MTNRSALIETKIDNKTNDKLNINLEWTVNIFNQFKEKECGTVYDLGQSLEAIGNGVQDNFSEIRETYDMETYNRLIKFNKKFNGGKDIIDKWIDNYNSYDISFPKEISERFKKLIKESRKFYKDFKNKKIAESNLYKFNVFIEESKKIEDMYLEFYLSNKDNRYLCNKKIEKFLDNNKMKITKEHILDNNAFISKGIRKGIYERSFVERFLKEISEFFSTFRINNIKVIDNYIMGEVKYEYFNPIKITITLRNFMSKFDNVLDGDFNYNIIDIIMEATILKELNSIDEFLAIISKLIKGYSFKCDYDLFQKHRINIYNYKSRKEAMIDMEKCMELRSILVSSREDAIKILKIL